MTAPGRRSSRGISRYALRLCAIVLAVSTVILGGVYLHYRSYVGTSVLDSDESTTVVIPNDTAWPGVVQILKRAELVGHPSYFEYWARRRRLPAAVKAGTYEFQGPMSLEQLGSALREGGQVDQTTISFPEGFTIFHMADRVEKRGLVGRKDFLRAARDPAALQKAGISGSSFEGYLFPDTYRFRKGTSAANIIRRMHARWSAVWLALQNEYSAQKQQLGDDYGFDRHDIVTLASLVERETPLDEERSVIAAVFLNRLDRDMRLQTDPTCVYGEDTYDQAPTPATCKDPLNRYSTYVIDGLPPGPIANPGRASLEAALNPSERAKKEGYLFFVARRDGTRRHYFSETFAEHKAAVRRFLR